MKLSIEDLLEEAQMPPTGLTDRTVYIQTVRNGVSGAAMKACTKLINRNIFIRALSTNSANFNRICRLKNLNRLYSEIVLDTLFVATEAMKVWDNQDTVLKWLNTPLPALAGDKPVDLFDTFDGRSWIREVLVKIKHGEFT